MVVDELLLLKEFALLVCESQGNSLAVQNGISLLVVETPAQPVFDEIILARHPRDDKARLEVRKLEPHTAPGAFLERPPRARRNVIRRRLGVGQSIETARPATLQPVTRAEFVLERDLPGTLSAAGPRHDNDHANIEHMQILRNLPWSPSHCPGHRYGHQRPSKQHPCWNLAYSKKKASVKTLRNCPVRRECMIHRLQASRRIGSTSRIHCLARSSERRLYRADIRSSLKSF
ncbi:hypothetical protein F4780DRAFT_322213 [Xylariomycetidae sp. FL0641]|nr:hypothetical protein F4780DRAFT_322213 [Xylariomycetidae sp. FL0641]